MSEVAIGYQVWQLQQGNKLLERQGFLQVAVGLLIYREKLLHRGSVGLREIADSRPLYSTILINLNSFSKAGQGIYSLVLLFDYFDCLHSIQDRHIYIEQQKSHWL